MSPRLDSITERGLLQIVVAIGCLVPILGGGLGVARGLAMIDSVGTAGADSHFRYLSGLLLGIGLAFLSTVPRIEAHSRRFRLLTAIVVIGGLGRALSLMVAGTPNGSMVFALGMELAVTPALALWQRRVASKCHAFTSSF